MKKLIPYILGFLACAWAVNQAVKLIMEVWHILALGGGLTLCRLVSLSSY